MRNFTGAQRRALSRRLPSIIIAISFALILATTGTAQAQTPAPEECEGIQGLASEIEGEVVDRLTLVDEFSTNIDLISVATETGTAQIEVDGRPELVEVGETYRFTVITIGADTPAVLSSVFGDNLSCLTTEVDPDDPESEPAPLEIGVATVDDEGVATPIEEPPFLPDLPVSPRTFFIGFAIFALVIFLIRFR